MAEQRGQRSCAGHMDGEPLLPGEQAGSFLAPMGHRLCVAKRPNRVNKLGQIGRHVAIFKVWGRPHS